MNIQSIGSPKLMVSFTVILLLFLASSSVIVSSQQITGKIIEIGPDSYSIGYQVGVEVNDPVCAAGESQRCGTTDIGACENGIQTCVYGVWGECTGAVYPKVEIRDGLDNDCDGSVDEGLVNQTNTTAPFDYNYDSRLNTQDTEILSQVAVGSRSCPQNKRCDVNSDGSVNIFDVNILVDYTTGKYDVNFDGVMNNRDRDLHFKIVGGVIQCPNGKNCDVNGDGRVSIADHVLFGLLLASDSANPANQVSFVYVNSVPTGAYIYVDDIQRGVTPATLTGFNVGPYSFKLTKAGYYDYTATINIQVSNTGNSLYPTLKPITQGNQTNLTGILYASTNPTGASLYVDNIYKGTTPITVTGLPVESHSIELRKASYYNYMTNVYIEAGKTTNLHQDLIYITQPNKPDLRISSMSFNPYSPAAGQNVFIKAEVKNSGINTDSSFVVRAEDSTLNKFIGNMVINGLPSGQTTIANFTYYNITPGNLNHLIKITADASNAVQELYENNNIFLIDLFVSGGGATCSQQPNYGGSCSVGEGACRRTGSYLCNNPSSLSEKPHCSATPGTPQPEICNDRIDNDCDGLADCSDRDCTTTSFCGNQTNVTADIAVINFNCYPTNLGVGDTVKCSYTYYNYGPDPATFSFGGTTTPPNTGGFGGGGCCQSLPPGGSKTESFSKILDIAGTWTFIQTVGLKNGIDPNPNNNKASVSVFVSGNQTNQTLIKVLYPNGGEILTIGKGTTLKWSINPYYIVDYTTGKSFPPGINTSNFTLVLFLTDGPTPGHIRSFNPVPEFNVYYWDDDFIINGDIGRPIEPGKYRIRAAIYDGIPCLGFCPPYSQTPKIIAEDYSDGYFSLISGNQTNQTNRPPVIHGISGPSQLKVGEQGSWTVRASDPENGPLTYSVVWGDESIIGGGGGAAPKSQTALFTHTYFREGTFFPIFTVTDNSGNSEKTGLSVQVGGGEDFVVYLNQEFKLEVGQVAVVKDYNNLRIKYVGAICTLDIPPSSCSYQFLVGTEGGQFGQLITLTPGGYEFFSGAKISLLDGVPTLIVTAETQPPTTDYGSINIIVYDSETSQPLSGAYVTVFNQDGKIVGEGVTGYSSSCRTGQTRACGSSVGMCKPGVMVCDKGLWGECVGDEGPTSEITDGLDNDCDGDVDEGTTPQPAACTLDARLCPDGSYVGRNPLLNCAFNSCPGGFEGEEVVTDTGTEGRVQIGLQAAESGASGGSGGGGGGGVVSAGPSVTFKLPAGYYTYKASKDGYIGAESSFRIVPGTRSGARIELRKLAGGPEEPPVCIYIGTDREGWYSNGQLIKPDKCGCGVECRTSSVARIAEGYYNSCTGQLILRADCSLTWPIQIRIRDVPVEIRQIKDQAVEIVSGVTEIAKATTEGKIKIIEKESGEVVITVGEGENQKEIILPDRAKRAIEQRIGRQNLRSVLGMELKTINNVPTYVTNVEETRFFLWIFPYSARATYYINAVTGQQIG